MSARERRDALLERLSTLSVSQRSALGLALAEGAGDSERRHLVAYVAPTAAAPTAAAPAAAAPTAVELDTFLEERLPEYMIPSRYVALARLPRTAAGKLDRRGVATAEGTDLSAAPVGFVPPTTKAEQELAEIWKGVLGIDEVGVHDDFFEIGGDSLLSIRVISRAGRAGITISPQAFFAGPTIARLATLGDIEVTPAEQGPVVGEAPLTPIQEWFFERITKARNHWNQSFLLEVPGDLDVATLEAAVASLVAHHDALRSRVVSRDNTRRQELVTVPDRAPVRVVDLSDTPSAERSARIESEASAEHASLDLKAGHLFRVVMFRAEAEFGRLLLLAHHLIVDNVSWGILLDDLSSLLAQSAGGSTPRLPPKTTSVVAWSEALVEAAGNPELTAAAAHWIDAPGEPPWTDVQSDTPLDGTPNRMGDAESLTLSLSPAQTEALLSETTRRAYGTVEEMLLGAFLFAWKQWAGSEGVQLDVEGHGRDAVEGLDASRTVGWFTTVFPLTVELTGSTAEAAVRSAREALAALPQGRGSHGLLRYLHPDDEIRKSLGARPRSQILFNYLGAVDDLMPPDSIFDWAPEPAGRARSDAAPRAYCLEVNARVQGGRITIEVEYSRAMHGSDGMAELVDLMSDALAAMSVHAPASATPFELAGLDDAGLSHVADLLAEIDGE